MRPLIQAPLSMGVDCHFLLQSIFPTQGSNSHLLHWQVDSLLLHAWEVCIYVLGCNGSSWRTWALCCSDWTSLVVAHGLSSPIACWDLIIVSRPGIEPCIRGQILNHWATKEVPRHLILKVTSTLLFSL